jgi:hypothetical protein
MSGGIHSAVIFGIVTHSRGKGCHCGVQGAMGVVCMYVQEQLQQSG